MPVILSDLRKQPPRSDARPVRQCLHLGPNDIAGNAAHAGGGIEAAVGSRHHAPRVTEHAGDSLDAVGHDFRMLDEIRERVDHPSHKDLILGERLDLETAKFMRVTRVRERQNESADLRAQDDRQMSLSGTLQSCGPS